MWKRLAFGTAAGIIPILAAATVLEKFYGAEFVTRYIYASLPVMILWGTMAFSSVIYLLKCHMWRRPVTLCLHMSLVLILVGALLTHISGLQGKIHLRQGDDGIRTMTLSDKSEHPLPFTISLREFSQEYYEGTSAPSDFISAITVSDGTDKIEGTVSMNKIFTYRNYRFYQTGFDADGRGTILSVSHDPCGIAVTYTGYIWLLLSIIMFFFEPDSGFRRLLRSPGLRRGVFSIVVVLSSASTLSSTPRTLPTEVADRFCDLYVYYNERIAPLQTVAREFTLNVYGKPSYRGLSAEQVLTGWLFFYDDWKNEPFIKIKGDATGRILGTNGKYARLTDFTDNTGYKLDEVLGSGDDALRREANSANEKFNLISRLSTGALIQIYPYAQPGSDRLLWYSLADRPDDDMPYDQWIFIRRSMDLVAERVAMKDYDGVTQLLGKIRQYQINEAGGAIMSERRFRAEKFYNRYGNSKPVAMGCLTVGILTFVLFCLSGALRRRTPRWAVVSIIIFISLLLGYLTVQIGLRWYISGHIPLSNGYETMQFMSWCSAVLALVLFRRFVMILPFGTIVCGASLLVAGIGQSSPQVGNLMPVLRSPLLSCHVMLVMTAYTLLAFTMLNGIMSLTLRLTRRGDSTLEEHLYTVSRVILYPAVFCLTLGIFIGAVWANVSWGRYWGWDPKEVWALITMMIYAAALHPGSLECFRRPRFFHIYCIVAFLTVLITYFGVNYLLGGLHSYA